jgi:peptidoglycan-N-acetylglucosamine deacetylase
MPRRPSLLIVSLSLALLFTEAIPLLAEAQVIKSGPPACPGIALTFDLCPVRNGTAYDRALVDYLIDHKIPATFFMSGRWIAKHDSEVERLLEIGFFEVGTHGNVHAHLAMQTVEEQREEIFGPVKILNDHYAHRAVLFRPPYGEYNADTIDVVRALGLQFIQWSIESGDPDPTLSADQIANRIEKRAKPGSIVVLHANGKGKQTHHVVRRLIDEVLPRKQLKPMTVSELLSCKQPAR